MEIEPRVVGIAGAIDRSVNFWLSVKRPVTIVTLLFREQSTINLSNLRVSGHLPDIFNGLSCTGNRVTRDLVVLSLGNWISIRVEA